MLLGQRKLRWMSCGQNWRRPTPAVSLLPDSLLLQDYKHPTKSFPLHSEPRWIVDQEIKRRINDYEANEREMKERLDSVRKEKQKKMEEMKRRANFARKRQVR